MSLIYHFCVRTNRYLIFILSIACTSKTYSLISIAGGRVNVEGRIIQRYDSNIASSPLSPVKDIIHNLTPRLTYLQDKGLLGIDSSFCLEVGRFYDNRQYNYENLNLKLGLTYPLTANS